MILKREEYRERRCLKCTFSNSFYNFLKRKKKPKNTFSLKKGNYLTHKHKVVLTVPLTHAQDFIILKRTRQFQHH